MSEKKISFDELKLGMGQVVEVMPGTSTTKAFMDVLLMGAIPDESIIIGATEDGSFPKLNVGEKIIFRIKLPDGIALFAANVLHIANEPIFMVYIDFPKVITYKKIRNALRVAVTLPVLVTNLKHSDMAIAGKIKDISTTGAGLELYEPIGAEGDEVIIKGKFEFNNIRRVLSIRAIVRSEKRNDGKFHFNGVEFIEDDENDLLVLFGFIFNAMSFGKVQNIR